MPERSSVPEGYGRVSKRTAIRLENRQHVQAQEREAQLLEAIAADEDREWQEAVETAHNAVITAFAIPKEILIPPPDPILLAELKALEWSRKVRRHQKT